MLIQVKNMKKIEKSADLLSKLTQATSCANREPEQHYYDEPHVAPCGHRMCKSCWKIKKKCITCGARIDLGNLQEDDLMKNLTELARNNMQTFKKMYSAIDLKEQISSNDEARRVLSWLSSSQNHFSIPPTQNPIFEVSHATETDLQIIPKKKLSAIPQEEFDLIQCIEESQPDAKENLFTSIQQKTSVYNENVILRRSKRRISHDNPKPKVMPSRLLTEVVMENQNANKKSNSTPNQDATTDKTSGKHSNISTHWNNVKQMKKEFSRNRRNVKKLNVTIEMCNKSVVSKSNEGIESEIGKNTPFTIEEDTPHQETRLSTSPNSEVLGTSITQNINFDKFSENRRQLHVKSNCKDVEANKNDEKQNDHVTLKQKHASSSVPGIFKENLLKSCGSSNATQHSHDIELPPVSFGKNISCDNHPSDPPQKSCQKIQPILQEDSTSQENKIPRVSCGDRKKNISTTRRIPKQLSVLQRKLNKKIFTNGKKRHQVLKYQRNVKKIGVLNVTTPEGNFIITGENICVMKLSVPCTEKSTQTEDNNLEFREGNSLEVVTPIMKNVEISKRFYPEKENITQNNYKNAVICRENSLAKSIEAVQSISSKSNTASEITATGPFKITESVEKEMSNEMVDIEVDTPQCISTDNKTISETFTASQDVIKKSKPRLKRLRPNTETELSNGSRKKKKGDHEPKPSQKTYPLEHTVDIFNSETHQHASLARPQQSSNILTHEFDEITSKAFAQIDADLFEQRKTKSQGMTTDVDQQEPPIFIDDNEDVLNNYNTPIVTDNKYNEDSESSFVEETPQKEKSTNALITEGTSQSTVKEVDSTVKENVKARIEGESCRRGMEKQLNTPLTLTHFSNQIVHESTPLRHMPRRSLDFSKTPVIQSDTSDAPSCHDSVTSDLVRTTLEKEFMERAFERTPHITPVRGQMSLRKDTISNDYRRVFSSSLLSLADNAMLMKFAKRRNWDFSETYIPELTHLIVRVNENKAQRTVKYIRAIAAGKWIISVEWIHQCIRSNKIVSEVPFEVLDMDGSNGPHLSRTATRKLFEDFTFYCHPPFSMFELHTLEDILISAGGRVVRTIEEVSLKNTDNVALVLAEPDCTLDENYTCLAMDKSVVPVNYEWMLSSLGGYSLQPLGSLLLCPASLVPFGRLKWPHQLLVDVVDSADADDILTG